MLRSLEELRGYALLATNGEIGRVKDFLFDDLNWTVRHLVADTGKWLPKRKVLISPVHLKHPDWKQQRFPVDLTKEAVEESPPLDEHAPVSRQKEIEFYSYYRVPPYWLGPHPWAFHATPDALRVALEQGQQEERIEEVLKDAADKQLRSVAEVTGYHIAATDGEVGHVKDFIVETSTWAIRWLVVDTGTWLLGRTVLIAPAWAESVSWNDRKFHVLLTTEDVKNSPEFDPSEPINPVYEAKLYDYYGRPQELGAGHDGEGQ